MIKVSRSWHQLTRSPLALLLIAFVCNTTLWASIVEPGHPPDELLHFDYIRYIATYHKLPVYGEAHYFFNPLLLQAHAMLPPLYYLLGVPVLMLFGDQSPVLQLYLVRSVSIAIGAVTVAAAYGTGRVIFPARPRVALALAALVAFNPMFTQMSAAINSDNLITTLSAVIFLVLAWGIRSQQPGPRWQMLLGILIGAGLLTKPTIVTAVVASGVTLVWLAWKQPSHRWRTFFAYELRVGGAALIVSGWSFVRNWMLYGDPTGLSVIGSRPHDSYLAVAFHDTGTLWQMIFHDTYGFLPFLPSLFKGFWGYFDHFELQMPEHIYTLLLVLCIGSMLGLLVGLIKLVLAHGHSGKDSILRKDAQAHRPDNEPNSITSHSPVSGTMDSNSLRPASLLMLVGIGAIYITLALVLVINACYRIDYQPQGRYLFSSLVPVMLMLVVGWEHLANLVRLRHLVAPLLIVIILAINGVALATTVLPSHINRHLNHLVGISPIPNLVETSYIAQVSHGPFETHTDFVPAYRQIDEIDAVLYRSPGFKGPIIWRIAQQNNVIVSATSYDLPDKLSRTAFTIPASVQFTPGTTYTLSIHAPWAPADKPMGVALPYAPYANDHPTAHTDLDILIRYHGQPTSRIFHNISRTLFPDKPGTPRTIIQIVLYPLVIVLFGVLAITAMRTITRTVWQAILVIALVIGINATLATASSQGFVVTIPEYQIAGTAGPLLALDNAEEDVYADLLLLSDSPQATKYPPDQLSQPSLIQPLYFQMHDTMWPVLFMHPTSTVTYALHIPASAYIETAIALNPVVWEENAGDGVEFAVRITSQNGQHELLRQTIDPINEPEQRTWNEVSLDLHAYANQDVLLCLETSPGPAGDVQFDWAGWREPAIVVR